MKMPELTYQLSRVADALADNAEITKHVLDIITKTRGPMPISIYMQQLAELLHKNGFNGLTTAQADDAMAEIEGFISDLAHEDWKPKKLRY